MPGICRASHHPATSSDYFAAALRRCWNISATSSSHLIIGSRQEPEPWLQKHRTLNTPICGQHCDGDSKNGLKDLHHFNDKSASSRDDVLRQLSSESRN